MVSLNQITLSVVFMLDYSCGKLISIMCPVQYQHVDIYYTQPRLCFTLTKVILNLWMSQESVDEIEQSIEIPIADPVLFQTRAHCVHGFGDVVRPLAPITYI